MDKIIAIWILEFLLRKLYIDEKIISGVLSHLLPSDINDRLKKTILLRKIESEILTAPFSEELLEFLEIIEELDHREGKTASNSMKEAYCTVAVDCTVRYLDENMSENGKYIEAVERVWRNRVCRIKTLGSEDLSRWWGDIEAAVRDSSVREKILKRNTRIDAVKAVKRYLKEGWESLGPAFLEIVASKAGNEVEKLRIGGGGGGGDGQFVSSDNPMGNVVSDQGTQKGQAIIRRKHIAVKPKFPKAAKNSDADEKDETTKIANDVVIQDIDKVQETTNVACDSHHGASQAAHKNDGNDVQVHNTDEMQEALLTCSKHNDSLLGASQTSHISSFTEITDNSNKVSAENQIKPVLHASPEVADPLPEALKTVENLCFDGVDLENDARVETHMASEVGPVQQTHESNSLESIENSPEKVKKTEKLVGNHPQAHETPDAEDNFKYLRKSETRDRRNKRNAETHAKEQPNCKRSLMEPNGTAHTLKWDDSIDSGSERIISLRSSKRSKVTPSQPCVNQKLRRERKKWTPEEEQTLRDAVKKLDKRWKFILQCYSHVFKDRTDVDLKDKWRNMERAS